jgi:lytic murein transglycosylase
MRRVLLIGLMLASPAVPQERPAFEQWLAGYRAAAAARGISPATLDAVLADLQPNQRAIALDRNQADESSQSGPPPRFDAYLARRLDSARINGGRAAHQRLAPVIAGIEARYGVPGPILIGIWGMETAYGRITGSLDVPQSLATLAWDGRRAELFTRELDAALEMVERGLAPRSRLKGSWAGAMGQPQFLPSSYLAYARDGDGDGIADIWTSEADTLASIANYLAENGWQRGVPWGLKVEVPASFDRARVVNPVKPSSCIRPLERHSRPLPAAEWLKHGITAAQPLPDVPLVLIEPDGPGQGAYLVTASYRALMAYNCSNFYALSVALLGDAVAR